MMYSNKFVVAIKAQGQILREFNDVVKLPFGTEFSILLKNLHNKRAAVSISIDGVDVLNDQAMIVNANSEVELSRYVKDLSTGNSFKFIERTGSIEQHRGVKLDDGIIRVTFNYEKNKPLLQPTPVWRKSNTSLKHSGSYSKGISNDYCNYNAQVTYCADPNASLGIDRSVRSMDSVATASCVSHDTMSFMDSDVGITVPGSINNQQFQVVQGFETEAEEHVMIIRLSGYVSATPVVHPFTVKTKPKCITCGKQNKVTAKFCAECGTALQVI